MTYKTTIRIFGLCVIVFATGCSSVSLKAKSKTSAEAMAEKTTVTISEESGVAGEASGVDDGLYVPGAYDSTLVPEGDEDGDGLSNMDEHVAGTNPRSKTSRPVIRQRSSTQFDVLTVPGRFYTVEYTTDLQSSDWKTLINRIGDGSLLSIDTASDEVRRYYRFRVRLE